MKEVQYLNLHLKENGYKETIYRNNDLKSTASKLKKELELQEYLMKDKSDRESERDKILEENKELDKLNFILSADALRSEQDNETIIKKINNNKQTVETILKAAALLQKNHGIQDSEIEQELANNEEEKVEAIIDEKIRLVIEEKSKFVEDFGNQLSRQQEAMDARDLELNKEFDEIQQMLSTRKYLAPKTQKPGHKHSNSVGQLPRVRFQNTQNSGIATSLKPNGKHRRVGSDNINKRRGLMNSDSSVKLPKLHFQQNEKKKDSNFKKKMKSKRNRNLSMPSDLMYNLEPISFKSKIDYYVNVQRKLLDPSYPKIQKNGEKKEPNYSNFNSSVDGSDSNTIGNNSKRGFKGVDLRQLSKNSMEKNSGKRDRPTSKNEKNGNYKEEKLKSQNSIPGNNKSQGLKDWPKLESDNVNGKQVKSRVKNLPTINIRTGSKDSLILEKNQENRKKIENENSLEEENFGNNNDKGELLGIGVDRTDQKKNTKLSSIQETIRDEEPFSPNFENLKTNERKLDFGAKEIQKNNNDSQSINSNTNNSFSNQSSIDKNKNYQNFQNFQNQKNQENRKESFGVLAQDRIRENLHKYSNKNPNTIDKKEIRHKYKNVEPLDTVVLKDNNKKSLRSVKTERFPKTPQIDNFGGNKMGVKDRNFTESDDESKVKKQTQRSHISSESSEMQEDYINGVKIGSTRDFVRKSLREIRRTRNAGFKEDDDDDDSENFKKSKKSKNELEEIKLVLSPIQRPTKPKRSILKTGSHDKSFDGKSANSPSKKKAHFTNEVLENENHEKNYDSKTTLNIPGFDKNKAELGSTKNIGNTNNKNRGPNRTSTLINWGVSPANMKKERLKRKYLETQNQIEGKQDHRSIDYSDNESDMLNRHSSIVGGDEEEELNSHHITQRSKIFDFVGGKHQDIYDPQELIFDIDRQSMAEVSFKTVKIDFLDP